MESIPEGVRARGIRMVATVDHMSVSILSIDRERMSDMAININLEKGIQKQGDAGISEQFGRQAAPRH